MRRVRRWFCRRGWHRPREVVPGNRWAQWSPSPRSVLADDAMVQSLIAASAEALESDCLRWSLPIEGPVRTRVGESQVPDDPFPILFMADALTARFRATVCRTCRETLDVEVLP